MNLATRFWTPVLTAGLVLLGCPATGGPEEETAEEPARSVRTEPSGEWVEEEVSFEAGERTVAGTLTRPDAGGRFPGILFIQGSGPTDRDWNNPVLPGSHGSGELLARRLARHGVVSLRYDKAGTGETAVPEPLSWGSYLAEQRAGLALLAEHAAVRADALLVAGHSEGGAHALHLAREGPGRELAGIGLLATAGRSLRDLILAQLRRQLRRGAGLDGEALEEAMGRIADALDAIARGEEVDPAEASPFPGIQRLLASLAEPTARPFAEALLVFDPAAAIAELEVPVLVLQGDRDIQVRPGDARTLAEAAREADVDVTLRIVEEADHVLKHEETPFEELSPRVAQGYSAEDRELDDGAVEAMVTWLAEVATAPSGDGGPPR